jgi:diguanylate cyclase
MIQHVDTRIFQEGDTIFAEGDISNYAYIIEDGEVEIFTYIGAERKVLNILTPGNLFGELALVDRQPRSASALATKRTTLTLVTQQQVDERLSDADPILRMLLYVVMKHFRQEVKRARSQYSTFTRKNISEDAETFNQMRILEAVGMARLEADLRTAIKEDHFRLFYQPVIDLTSGTMVSLEALIRWENPKRGLLAPLEFIEIAEATNLILPIGRWVVAEGLAALKQIQNHVKNDLSMSFNVARRQMEHADFLPSLAESVHTENINPRHVHLEILERNLFLRSKMEDWITACAKHGFPVLLDDFGTGYSSLLYLQQFQPASLKIDRSFISGLPQNKESRSICKAIIDLATAMNIGVIAEGIETAEQATALRELGCIRGQGYLYSKPVPVAGIIDLISKKAG